MHQDLREPYHQSNM